MLKKLLALVLLLAFFALPAAAQDSAFTIETIPVDDLPAYDMKVAPDGRTAAVYVGTTSLAVLGVPSIEYAVDDSGLPIRLIDLATGEEVARFSGPTDYISDVAFTPDSTQLASYHRNGEIYLWDIASGQLAQRITAVMGGVRLAFLPDGRTLAAYMADSMIGYFMLWDMETGHMTRIWRASFLSYGDVTLSQAPASFGYRYTAFDISPDGALLATATPNGEVVVWDTADLAQTIVQPKAAEEGRFNVRGLRFSADGTALVYYDSLSEQTHLWDVGAQTETAAVDGGSHFFALSPGGDALVWVTRTEVWYMRLDEPDSATKVMDFPEDLLVAAPVVTFISDNTVVIGGFGGRTSGGYVIYQVTLN